MQKWLELTIIKWRNREIIWIREISIYTKEVWRCDSRRLVSNRRWVDWEIDGDEKERIRINKGKRIREVSINVKIEQK